MNDLEDYLNSIPPGAYDCTHPGKPIKQFSAEKVKDFCLTAASGNPCPFLIPVDARDGRDDATLYIRPTKRRTRRFPGE